MNKLIRLNEEKDLFQISDYKGRKKALEYLYKQLTNKGCNDIKVIEPDEKYSHYDLLLTATTKSNQTVCYCIECKDRPDLSSTSFDSDMIEIKKYYNLLTRAELNDETPLYIMTFNDDTAIIHNLFNANKFKEKKYRKKTTVINTGYEDTYCYQLLKDDNTTTITLN